MANTFNNNAVTSVGTTPTELYSTGVGTKATVIGINVANILTQTVTCDIIFEDELTQPYFIVKGAVIPAGSSLAAIGGDQKLALNENNRILVNADNPNAIDAIISVLEIT